jgi:hypothetical protein
MVAADAEEIHDLSVEIVVRLDGGWFPVQKDRPRPSERLTVVMTGR